MASVPLAQDGGASEADLVLALAARVETLEKLVQTTLGAIDEKALKELRRTVDALAKRDPKFEERVTNKVDVIADRIETVAKTVSTSSAAAAARDGELVQLRREVDARLTRVDAALQAAVRGGDPAELADIRRKLDDLSTVAKQRMPRGLEGRIDELTAKLQLVGQRVDSVSSTVSTTASGLAGRDGDVNALRRAYEAESDRIGAELAELRRAVDPRAVIDLRQELKELAQETARGQHSSRQLIGQAAAKVDALAERFESLATSLASTSDRLAGTEQHVVALRGYLEDNGARVQAVQSEHQKSLATLSAQAAALEQADGRTALALEELVSATNEKIDGLIGRLDPLSAAVAATSERLEEREVALQGMENRFDTASSRANDLVADLSRALAEFPDPNGVAEQLTPRIDELAERTASLTASLAQVETSVSEQLDSLTASLEATVGRVAGADEELTALRTSVDEEGGRLGSLSSLVAEQRQLLDALAARTASLEQADGLAADLGERVLDLGGRVDGLRGRLESFADSMTSTTSRLSGNEDAVSELRAYVEEAGGRLSSMISEHKRSLAEHTQSLAALGARTASLEKSDADTTGILDEQFSDTRASLTAVSGQVDTLAARLESAVTSLDDKERELVELHRQGTESSSRIETIVEDIRDALGALPDASPDALEQMGSKLAANTADMASLAGRLERLEAVHLEQVAAELAERFDRIDSRIAAVAAEMGRAKTLWPVALRSLEARLDDALPPHEEQPLAHASGDGEQADLDTDDLLAGLRDSLHEMENVAEEVARASEAWSADERAAPEGTHETVSGGARIVPLRVIDP